MCAQPSDTADIVTALEEGQLILGGLASNRYEGAVLAVLCRILRVPALVHILLDARRLLWALPW